MHSGTHPTSDADHRLSPSAAMLANMSRLPSIPSRAGLPQSYPSYGPYDRANVGPSRPDIALSSQHHRSGDAQEIQSHAQQLPSLRTLLEPGTLNPKLPEPTSRSGGGHVAQGSSARFGSSSPTLKRRHDFDNYNHDNSESNAIVSRAPPVHRHAQHPAGSDPQSSTFSALASTPSSHPPDFSRHGSLPRLSHGEPASRSFRAQSTVSAMCAPSDPVGSLPSQHAHGDPMDLVKPIRRRPDILARAPVRASRCLGQREIPGEGLCYIYEDGTYCRAVIDGEPVNPSWGITKAGKPRKRLAQACLTCREKKIKCEPGYPKCHQCAKSQRACRGGLNQPSMSNASGETSPSDSAVLYKTQSAELVGPQAGLDKPPRAQEDPREPSRTVESWSAGSPYKNRIFRPNSVATSSRDMSVHSLDSDWSGSVNNQDPDGPRRGSHQDQLALQWEQDPFDMDPRLTMHLLDLYFTHAGRATYGMFPRRPFSLWVENNHDKGQDHLMLLYSVLAIGSLFSTDPEKRSLGKRFAAVAAYATEKRFGRFTLQLCQSRLMLALYNFARGKSQEAWDFCGAGLRAISALKLNTEEGVRELPDSSADLDYGFDRPILEECCRRTFWSGFLMDRYNGFCGGTICFINIEDTFLRLPGPENLYEASIACDSPFFDFETLSQQSPPGPPLGHMAYLTLISAIWGDVLTFTSRSVHRPDTGYERIYEAFYARTYERLDTWLAMLPANLRYTSQNLDNSIVEGFAGSFVSLHALYHTTIIRLNRHVRVRALSPDKLSRNIDQTFRSASQFLTFMCSLSAQNRQQRLPPTSATDFLFPTPFPGYSLMLAVDVVSAVGMKANLPNVIETLGLAVSCIEELANFWASARAQHKAVVHRIKQLTDLAIQEERGIHNGNYGPFWKLTESLETAFGNEDVVYKVNEQALFEVVGGLAGR